MVRLLGSSNPLLNALLNLIKLLLILTRIKLVYMYTGKLGKIPPRLEISQINEQSSEFLPPKNIYCYYNNTSITRICSRKELKVYVNVEFFMVLDSRSYHISHLTPLSIINFNYESLNNYLTRFPKSCFLAPPFSLIFLPILATTAL